MSIKGAEIFRKKNRFLVIKRSANFIGGFIIYFYYFIGITHFSKVIRSGFGLTEFTGPKHRTDLIIPFPI